MTDTMLIISFAELCQSEQLNQEVIIDVVEYGIAQPISGNHAQEWIFDTGSVHWLKKAVRLHYELEIDWVAVAVIVDLLKQQETLKSKIETLQNRLERY
ncbi:chaperone modulator CbpM [Aliiglaciecola litoralis]|uniref:Chaperone modulator CbpM n=1 Tax=Aliiglaciecola litoralis TaxID=582857 RepID=A0ABN1LRM7_9ALTE